MGIWNIKGWYCLTEAELDWKIRQQEITVTVLVDTKQKLKGMNIQIIIMLYILELVGHTQVASIVAFFRNPKC